MVTRLTKLDGFEDLLAGRDLGKIFKEGHVYQVQEIVGQIIFTDLGEHAKMPIYEGQAFSSIMLDGRYCLTKEEYEKSKNNE